FMRNNPDYSTIPTFARKAQVIESTVRRIISHNARGLPSQANVMSILLVLTGLSNIRDVVLFFLKNKSAIGFYLKKHTVFYSYAMDVTSGLTMEGVTSPSIPKDNKVYIAYTLVSSRGRASFMEVVQKMGDSAHIAVDRLIKAGVLKMDSDGYLTLTSDVPVLTKQTGLLMGKALVDAYANAEARESNISLVINSVNEQGLVALEILQREYIIAVSRLANTHKGINRVYIFNVCDSMEFRKGSILDAEVNE
ncbi:MAG TPA: hypothetical protein PLU50_11550, partial [Pseudobdellovibrionaceae bacterium]|nr:hypothetical protein [Pseudobdellovibrionaceae bacterium]